MRKRGAPSPSFYVLVCEAVIPGNAASVSIEGIPLPLPKATIANIVVVGDTGCKGNTSGKRMKKVTPMEEPEDEEEEAAASPSAKPRKKTENCILKSVWPLPAIAKNAAAKKPDLVIHVGDYVYVTEEDWIQWKTQFFKPARDLLLAAPWIFIRGNHETCERHRPGYFYLLDPRKDASCPTGRDHTDPYLVSAGGSQFLVMDSSGANCDYTPNGPGTGCKVDDYSQEKPICTGLFHHAKTLIGSRDLFLLTHRPLWGIKAPSPSCPLPPCLQPATASKGLPGRNLVAINSAMQEAYQQANRTGIKMVVSGHIHNFQLVTYQKQDSTDPLPQLVVGDSGVEL